MLYGNYDSECLYYAIIKTIFCATNGKFGWLFCYRWIRYKKNNTIN